MKRKIIKCGASIVCISIGAKLSSILLPLGGVKTRKTPFMWLFMSGKKNNLRLFHVCGNNCKTIMKQMEQSTNTNKLDLGPLPDIWSQIFLLDYKAGD